MAAAGLVAIGWKAADTSQPARTGAATAGEGMVAYSREWVDPKRGQGYFFISVADLVGKGRR